MGAEGDVAVRLRDVETDARLEPLALAVDQRQQRDRRLAQTGCELRERVEGRVRRCVEDAVLTQNGEPLGLVRRQGCSHNDRDHSIQRGGRCARPEP